MPEEEDRTPSPTPPPPAPTRKGKGKAKQPQEPTRKSTRIPKPSYYVSRILRGEGTPTGHNAEDEPADAPTPEARRYYHPDWPFPRSSKAGPSASSAYVSGDTTVPDFAYLAEIEEALQAAITEASDDPKTLEEARSRSDWPKWQEAMDREIKTLEDAGTWTTVPKPPGKNVVGSKWVFRIKRKADGTIEKYKARLVARGFTQRPGIDYFDTFSPVARLASFRAILAMAARNDWEVHTFDFNGTYLNGKLDDDEEIYMQPPPGYESQGELVKRLLKSLYGLKQAGRKWYLVLYRALIELGFTVNAVDPGIFYARRGDHIIILAIHVDDCMITGSSVKLIAYYKESLNARYPLTDLGEIHWLLGIKITRDREARTISLTQTSYIETILDRFSLSDAKPYTTPIVPGATYSRLDSPSDATEVAYMAKVPYREAIGSLMYASVATRPDITFAISYLSQFLENPGRVH